MTKPYEMTVVDVREMNLREELYDYLADRFEISNDGYYRFNLHDTYMNQEFKNELILNLGNIGLDLNQQYILLHFDW
jgi:hypothetical protein